MTSDDKWKLKYTYLDSGARQHTKTEEFTREKAAIQRHRKLKAMRLTLTAGLLLQSATLISPDGKERVL